MGHRRCGRRHGEFEDMSGYGSNGCHRGGNSLIGLIFDIVSFSITLAFKIVGVVFQTLFGLLSGIIRSGSRNEQAASYSASGGKQEPAAEKPREKATDDMNNNVRDFKRPEKNKAEASSAEHEDKNKSEEVHNKDFYVFLFILTIIPAIVALAIGRPLYAGVIGAAGLALMMAAGIVSGLAGMFRKKGSEPEEAEDEEEAMEDTPVEKLIKDAFEKLFVIRKDIDRIPDEAVRKKLEAICCTGEKIIGEVRSNPEGLTHVRKFFYYYLDAFSEIVKKYIRLSSFEKSSEEIGKVVAETESSFNDIQDIFKELCEKLLEKDMMNLKAEINVMKNSN